MNKKIKKASFLNISINIFLMLLNLVVGLFFSTLSFISKGIESLQDVLTSIIIHFTIKYNNKDADDTHPFGHTRAENIAGYTIGILMLFLGLEILKSGISKFLNPQFIQYSSIFFIVIFVALILKIFLYTYIKIILKTNSSPALKANLQDHFNDILMYLGLLLAVIGIKLGYYIIDSLVAIIIGLIILISGFRIIKENISFLMGSSADSKLELKIKKLVMEIPEIINIGLLKTQYLGNKIQVEIHIGLNSKMDLKTSHDLGNKVRNKIKNLDEVVSCFVHIDPYDK